MVDFTNDQLVGALGAAGCPLCRAFSQSELWEITTFVREGRFSREARPAFHSGGGYCHHHAWLLHSHVVKLGSGAPIADLYESVLKHDRAELRDLQAGLTNVRRWRRRPAPFRRKPCLACTNVRDADDRHAYFFLQALREQAVRRRYAESDGLCLNHVRAVYEQALAENDHQVAVFLAGETIRRLDGVAAGLAEYDRKRDHRYADEPRGDEQHSWTDVIRLYVGDQFLLL